MNGVVIIDKPQGMTSHDVVAFMRRLTGIRKIGHTGTLDPMATGVLPICIGCATKAADMLTLSDKAYTAEFVLGKTTDTLDIWGNVTGEHDVNVSEDEIREAVLGFVGEIEQIPPMYSAIKKQGKRLYELAREGVEVKREPRRVTIKKIEIKKIEGHRVTISVECSKGTYIRTLCADIGDKLKTGACMSVLRRTRTGPFSIECAVTPEEARAQYEAGNLNIISTDSLFADLPKIMLNEKQTRSITNGVRMTWRNAEEGETFRLYDSAGGFLCVSRIKDGRLTLVKSFRN